MTKRISHYATSSCRVYVTYVCCFMASNIDNAQNGLFALISYLLLRLAFAWSFAISRQCLSYACFVLILNSFLLKLC